jgi:hypothetical protein
MSRNAIHGMEWVEGSSLLFGEPLRSYRKGRICATKDCGTYLSRYNPNAYCSIH